MSDEAIESLRRKAQNEQTALALADALRDTERKCDDLHAEIDRLRAEIEALKAACRDAHIAEAETRAEPIFCRDTGCSCNDELPDYAAEQAEPKRPPTCRWSRADDDTDLWETTCGKAFTIIDGSPADNQMAFCCYCGRELESETGDSDAE